MSRLFRAFLAVVCLGTALFAQSGNQGSITGTVTDASGAVVPNANVTATNKQTSTQFTSTTSDQGTYTFPVVPVGDYELRVSGSGFGVAAWVGGDASSCLNTLFLNQHMICSQTNRAGRKAAFTLLDLLVVSFRPLGLEELGEVIVGVF